ncbi:MAG: hypothetical protein WBV23_08150 [Desulfobaccales bacterium]
MHRLISICLCLMFLGLSGTHGYAAKMDPQATPDEEMLVAGQKPEVAKIKELMNVARTDEAEGFNISALKSYQAALQLSEQALGPNTL